MMAVAMVTGASRGIGKGVAVALAEAGFDVVGTATSVEGLEAVKDEVEVLGRRFVGLAGNLGDLEEVAQLAEASWAAFGRLDVLVNNAGVAPLVRLDLLDMTPESYERVMNINLRGPLFLTQAIARKMTGQEGSPRGRIIFVTSVSATHASPERTEYCVSKAGLSMLARSYAVALGPHEIPVFELQPGVTRTDMTSGVEAKYDRQISEGLLLTPRWGTPEDMGRACVPFARGDFDYATGAAIEVGGGLGVPRL